MQELGGRCRKWTSGRAALPQSKHKPHHWLQGNGVDAARQWVVLIDHVRVAIRRAARAVPFRP